MARDILILDPPSGELSVLAQTFEKAARAGARVEVVRSRRGLLDRLRLGGACDLVVLDYHLGDGRTKGRVLLRELRAVSGVVPIVVVAEEGDVDLAARVVRAGANDLLVRGKCLKARVATQLAKVRQLLDLIEQNRALDAQNAHLRQAFLSRFHIVGESPQIVAVLERLERVAGIPRPVLITGERGTGKELVARAIHESAGETQRPFVAVNCAAFAEALLESEIFGHEKGAYTGADTQTRGRFEQAAGGTLFLDEIGNMSLPFQQKILRVVEYGAFRRVGGREDVRTDARIIAATNIDLDAMMERGEFLHDLYDRLAFERLHVPALVEREGDIDLLAQHFLWEFMREVPSLAGKRLSRAALVALRGYRYPGNVRELKNIVERGAYRAVEDKIGPDDLGIQTTVAPSREDRTGTFDDQVDQLQRHLILGAFDEAGGNQAQAARTLGLSYHQYRYYFRKFRA